MNFTVRTIDEIFQELLNEKQSLSNLNELSPNTIVDEETLINELSNGNVPEWVLWLYNQAVHTHLTEYSIQTGINDITTALETKVTPTAEWYVGQAKKFQYGYALIIDDNTYKPKYSTIDETAQIIETATTLQVQNRLNLKVKRQGGLLLSADERSSFESYINQIKAAGTQIIVENYNPDQLTINAEVIYKASANKNTVQSAVEDVINDYLVNIRFDSKFITSDLEKRIFNEVDNVRDFRFNESDVVNDLGATTTFLHEAQLLAGHGIINSSTPLSNTITYTAK